MKLLHTIYKLTTIRKINIVNTSIDTILNDLIVGCLEGSTSVQDNFGLHLLHVLLERRIIDIKSCCLNLTFWKHLDQLRSLALKQLLLSTDEYERGIGFQ